MTRPITEGVLVGYETKVDYVGEHVELWGEMRNAYND